MALFLNQNISFLPLLLTIVAVAREVACLNVKKCERWFRTGLTFIIVFLCFKNRAEEQGAGGLKKG